MWKLWHTPDGDRFEDERRRMVDSQIAARGVTDPRVLEVMREIPRHEFVPLEMQPHAYEDHPVQIGQGQTISQPYMVAAMTQELGLREEDRVLEIGTGSGYQTAILARLAAEVITIERNESLAVCARARLLEQGYANITVVIGDGTLGCPEHAPYDAIMVTAGGPRVSDSLKEQLAMGGRMVCPIGTREYQKLIRIVRTPEGFDERVGMGCVFVPLIGREGWPEP